MSLKILIVDDATFVRDMVKRTVRQLVPDAQLFEAPDGARATGVIKSKKPDLILSDWEMPEMSGDQLLKWVRENPASANTPFVMITSRGDRNHVINAVNSGVSDYLSKPFTAEELQRKISKQLKKIGYTAPVKNQNKLNPAGGAFSSLDILTGNKSDAPTTPGSSKKAAEPKSAKTAITNHKAFLRFPHTTCECTIKDLSLQALNGTMTRPDIIPTVFDQASVDIVNREGQAVARLNAYIHAISAAEQNPNTTKLRVILRFVDQDPQKMEVLSKLIGD